MQNRLMLAALLMLPMLLVQAEAAEAYPKIVRYYDGDTVKIDDGMRQYKLRINDIDAPERNQAYGKLARRALINLCKHAQVQVQLSGIDKYQRDLGQLHCNQQSVSTYMVANGYAWFNQRYSIDGSLWLAEQHARQQKLGLWQSSAPLAPWRWRQKHAHAYANSP